MNKLGVKAPNRPELIKQIEAENIPVADIETLARPIIEEQVKETLAKTEADTKAYHDLRKKQEAEHPTNARQHTTAELAPY